VKATYEYTSYNVMITRHIPKKMNPRLQNESQYAPYQPVQPTKWEEHFHHKSNSFRFDRILSMDEVIGYIMTGQNFKKDLPYLKEYKISKRS
jgi:hypothetical protein